MTWISWMGQRPKSEGFYRPSWTSYLLLRHDDAQGKVRHNTLQGKMTHIHWRQDETMTHIHWRQYPIMTHIHWRQYPIMTHSHWRQYPIMTSRHRSKKGQMTSMDLAIKHAAFLQSNQTIEDGTPTDTSSSRDQWQEKKRTERTDPSHCLHPSVRGSWPFQGKIGTQRDGGPQGKSRAGSRGSNGTLCLWLVWGVSYSGWGQRASGRTRTAIRPTGSHSTYDPEKKVDLAWLEEHLGPHLDWMEKHTGPVMVENKNRCPFHPFKELKVLNCEAEFGSLYYKCPMENCPVWCTSETLTAVLSEFTQNTHPQVRTKITALQCQCGLVPNMKLSRTNKNYHRVFLTCGKREKKFYHTVNPCGYFQWMHGPLWKPKRPSQPTLEQFQAKVPRWQTRSTPQGEYFEDGQKGFSTVEPPPPSSILGCFCSRDKKDDRAFERACDQRNEERKRNNCAPYSYDTYRKYGLGIF